MLSTKLSANQLLDIIDNLDEMDRIEVRAALENRLSISEVALEELSRRKKLFDENAISSKPWEEIKGKYGL